jgi:hypothetical protein
VWRGSWKRIRGQVDVAPPRPPEFATAKPGRTDHASHSSHTEGVPPQFVTGHQRSGGSGLSISSVWTPSVSRSRGRAHERRSGSSRSSVESSRFFDGSRMTIPSPGSRCTHRAEHAEQVSQFSEIRMSSLLPHTGHAIAKLPASRIRPGMIPAWQPRTLIAGRSVPHPSRDKRIGPGGLPARDRFVS